uniref:Uncharacterized protein n=1 Tax=Triticum urartu TaxID=4572 RepID=A0A8R7V965_TRIUA
MANNSQAEPIFRIYHLNISRVDCNLFAWVFTSNTTDKMAPSLFCTSQELSNICRSTVRKCATHRRLHGANHIKFQL